MSQTWEFGGGHLLGLGDMSEANGDIPGTREGQPGHPEGTHVNGHDMDIAYYQLTGDDNHLRAVCEHYQGGQDAYHCTSEPVNFDLWRTALFLAKMHDNPRLRVIGVDGKLGVQVPQPSVKCVLLAGFKVRLVLNLRSLTGNHR